MGRLIDLVPKSGLSDGGVSLRLWTPEDVELVIAAAADPDIVRWTNVQEHVGRDDAVLLVEDMLAQSEGDGEPGS